MLRPEGTFVGQVLLDGGSMHLTAGNMSASDIRVRMCQEGLGDKHAQEMGVTRNRIIENPKSR